MRSKILCGECKKQINSKKDLITAMYFLKMKTYHANCYSRGLKTIKTFFLGNYPINSISGTISAVVGAIIALFVLRILLIFGVAGIITQQITDYRLLAFIGFFSLFLLAAILPLFLRLYSYFKYEKQMS